MASIQEQAKAYFASKGLRGTMKDWESFNRSINRGSAYAQGRTPDSATGRASSGSGSNTRQSAPSSTPQTSNNMYSSIPNNNTIASISGVGQPSRVMLTPNTYVYQQTFNVPDPYQNGKTIPVKARWDGTKWQVVDRSNSEITPDILGGVDPTKGNNNNSPQPTAPITPINYTGSGEGENRYDNPYQDYLDRLNRGLDDSAVAPMTDQSNQQSGTATASSEAALQQAYDDAFNRVTGRFTDKGLDATNYSNQIRTYLDGLKSSILPGSLNPSQYFQGDLTSPIIDQITSDNVQKYTTDINNTFGTGFENQYFGPAYNIDDQIISSLLDKETTEAEQYFNNALVRGNTTQGGYYNALDRLNDQVTSARSRLTDSAEGIIEGYRGQLRDVGQQARDKLQSYTLGTDFNLDGYQQQLSDLYSNLQNRFEGDFRSTVGNAPLIDSNSLLQRSNAVQPASNDQAGSSGVLAAIAARRNREEERRGVGTTGTF